jgi:holo-[acyl-carrier protein] synthase
LDRVYTEREVSDCRSGLSADPERLAARFAAKEATLKVLRVGDHPIPWREIEVRRDASGWVDLSLTGQAATLAKTAGIARFSVSLTHECGCAAAVVIAEIDEAADT